MSRFLIVVGGVIVLAAVAGRTILGARWGEAPTPPSPD